MIQDNVEKIFKDIEDITGKPYDQAGVTLLAATKMQSVEKIEQALQAGITDIGENKVQEMLGKYDALKDQADFHMIGSLQSNKVKDVISKVKLIHSLDRMSLLKELEKRCKREGIVQDCLIQVNVSKEDTKSGVYLEDIDEFLDEIEKRDHVRVKGLMTMAPHYEDPEECRWVFEALKKLFDEISTMKYNNISMEYLSMGMTHDYKVALESGANIIRIGSAIFGKRHY